MESPVVAIINNSCPPYRLALHRRFVREIQQIKFYSLLSHEKSDVAYAFREMEEINPVSFGEGESSATQAVGRNVRHEWQKGGRIIQWLKEHNTRAVVIGGYNDAGRLRIIRWCRRNNIPCMLQADSNIRGDTTSGVRGIIKRIVVGKVVRSCKAILPCGSMGRDYFIKYGARREDIFFVPYEPDYAMILNLPQSAIDAARQRFSLRDGRRRMVYSGRLIGVKRVDLLIDAFSAIASQRPEWDLLIVGDGPLRKELEARVPAGLHDRVQWTGFLDDQPAISAIYRQSDLLVLPSDHEPWAVVLNEAAAAGMAIIASDVVGAAAELVRDGANGRIFRKGDLAHLTQCLLDVTDPARIDGLKKSSRQVLTDWQKDGDPVKGMRAALKHVGVIP